ncbi:Dienelactone hydrolase endo-1,3,1,4-beta-D-glucanase [Mycena chlorophos]|uniref:Dienelactone hydrolase endo-1,3,1,4-beta-D-glucanase n=1 Tax=Mycena chlorophos TaxID=658473 RepID=A0A8H6SIM9_MYCCL|nr:Dienelactone hydrolase endo-1,3,1,4-beta-D-glucanase [Mycena chlorophos]
MSAWQSYLHLIRIHPVSTLSNTLFGTLCILSSLPFLGIPFPSRATAEYYADKSAHMAEVYNITPGQAATIGGVGRTLVGLGVIYPPTRWVALAVNGAVVLRGSTIAWRDGRPMLPQYGMLGAMAFCARHEGDLEGVEKTIGGILCYVATPKGDYAKNKAILYLADAFGLYNYPNNKLLADDFARNGFLTIIPDILAADPPPVDAFEPKPPGVPPFDIPAWTARHGRDVTRPIIDSVVAALKADGITRFAATGYCFGGRYVFDLAFDNITQVSAISHPSLLVVPEDLHKYQTTSNAPLLINNCTVDRQFPLTAAEQADAILGDGKFSPGYKRMYHEGCAHGFAVRAKLDDPKSKAGKEAAFTSVVEGFRAHL